MPTTPPRESITGVPTRELQRDLVDDLGEEVGPVVEGIGEQVAGGASAAVGSGATVAGTVNILNPVRGNPTGGAGGPCVPGHVSCPSPPWPERTPEYQWVIACGMDLSAAAGTEVVSAFDGFISKATVADNGGNPHIYGSQVSIQSNNHVLGAWYTHLENIPTRLASGMGQSVSQGDRIGTIVDRGGSSHVHFAPGQRVNGTHRCWPEAYPDFSSPQSRFTGIDVTFFSDGSRPSY